MAVNLLPLPRSSARPGPFAKNFSFRSGTDERDKVVQAVKRAQNDQCRIYVLASDEECYGFMAISLSTVGDDELPMLVLEYLFASFPYRGNTFTELGDVKIGEYLLAQAVELAMTISTIAPVRFIGLEPANERLASYYQQQGFQKLYQTKWLYAKLPKASL